MKNNENNRNCYNCIYMKGKLPVIQGKLLYKEYICCCTHPDNPLIYHDSDAPKIFHGSTMMGRPEYRFKTWEYAQVCSGYDEGKEVQ